MKSKTVFFCNECGNETSKWTGRCMACGAWNSIVEQKITVSKNTRISAPVPEKAKPLQLAEIALTREERVSTGISEFDRVLGGGIVKGSLILVGGDPGIGKSTLLLQMCQTVRANDTILYASGEESQKQIKMRAERLSVTNPKLLLLAETNMADIRSAIETTRPSILIIDSVQTIFCPELEAAPGSVSQVREVALTLMRIAKDEGISIFLVGHVTKDGTLAGPRILEHMVDCVLYFEGEQHHFHRVLRGVKNRFGSTNEIGVFEMTDRGLCPVDNPSGMFLAGRPTNVSGTAVTCSIEGTRPVLAEIQALVTKTFYPAPKRTSAGIDYNRVSLIMAVLEKRAKLNLSTQDAYINVTGGMRIDEPAADLGVAVAIASAYKDFTVPSNMVIVGELGLTGEVRAVTAIDKRITEAEKLGFQKIMIPKANANRLPASSIQIVPVEDLHEALAFSGKM